MAETDITVIDALNNITSNQYADTPFAGTTWSWDDGAANTFRQTIKEWNLKASEVSKYLKESPRIKTDSVDRLGFTIINALGETYKAPKQLQAALLINGLQDADRTKFEQFKEDLDQHRRAARGYSDKAVTSVPGDFICGYVVGSDKEVCQTYDQSGTWLDHMDTLYEDIEKLWNYFAKDEYDRKFEEDLPNFSDIVYDDFIIVWDIDKVLDENVLNKYDVYFRPEASDIPNLTGRYNPPPHMSTRTFSPTAFNFEGEEVELVDFTFTNLGTPGGGGATGIPGSSFQYTVPATYKNFYGIKNPATSSSLNNQLGFMYQDIINTNKRNHKGKKVKNSWSRSIRDLWGFQFMYNPTSFSYTSSANPDIDWAGHGGSGGDVAALLFGQASVEVKLILNRIVDMSALRSSPIIKDGYNRYGERQYILRPVAGAYPRNITEEDIYGILSRGTEYDIEYLYRVLNGDPEITPTMKTGTKTSDFGLIYGLPVWIRFHDNLRYKVVVTSLSVNHVLFTHDMIPMFTELSLSLMRIPVIAYDSDLADDIFTDLVTATKTDQDTVEE